jgi:hypothetical protein
MLNIFPKIKIGSTGTGSTDGLASQLLCKINILMFASYYGYQYIEIPFDDSYIKGNSGHRFGAYSTALQNIIFSFPGFEKIDPLSTQYDRVKIISLKDVDNKIDGVANQRIYINEIIKNEQCDFDIFVLNGFFNLFKDKTYLFNKLSRGKQVVVDPSFLNKSLMLSEVFKICLHIRRGDILNHEINRHRIIPLEYFDQVLMNVKKILIDEKIPFQIYLHTEGELENFNHDYIRFSETNPISSFCDFLTADLIISSKSSHSNVPGMISGQLMIYPHDSWFPPLPHWISADQAGNFNSQAFTDHLKTFFGSVNK